MNVSGRKEDMIDFLYFLENVGAIKMENGVLEIHKDDKLTSKSSSGLGRNIYKNQLFDVETFRMQEYMDSDNSPTEKDFVTYIRENQGREKISVEMGLRFYVRGLPNYKVKAYIKELAKKQDELVKKINLKLKDLKKLNNGSSSDVLISINDLKSMTFDLTDIGKSVAKLDSTL
jgi:hypothetical protein